MLTCQGTDPNETDIVLDGEFSNIWAEYTSPTEIVFLGSQPYTNTGESNAAGELWARGDRDSCNNLLIVEPGGKSYKLYQLESNKENGADGIDEIPQPERDLLRPYFPDSCEIRKTLPDPGDEGADKDSNNVRSARSFPLGGVQIIDPTDESGPPSQTTVSGDDAIEENADCNSEGGEFSFILCPFLKFC